MRWNESTWKRGRRAFPCRILREKKVFLANPDGSDDEVTFDVNTRKYTVIQQVAAPGKGKMSYLLHA